VRQQSPPLVAVGPYVLLAVLTAITVVARWSAPGPLAADLALCALTAAWMLWCFTLGRARPAVFFTGLIALTAVLVVRDPWFGCFTPVAYVFAFRLLDWPWRLPGVAAVAIVAGTAQASQIDKTTAFGLLTFFLVLAVNVLPMCGYAWYAWRIDQRNAERRQALDAVRAANRRLEATLAENAGLHEQLIAQARAAGAADERQRMAREIHDTLAQGLTGIITQLQAAEQAAGDPADWRRHLGAATGLARESLSEARRSVHALRPEALETARLAEALDGVADRWSTLHGPPVDVITTGTPRPIRPDVEAALLRIAQEALANVAKHAEASRVGVTLSYLEREVALDVRDDGKGFDPAVTVAGSGFGLVAMRQRVEDLGGTLQIESEPGTGTGISARVPVAGP
jgi:signal transduction histidine kinase